jgi:hypothetical protein
VPVRGEVLEKFAADVGGFHAGAKLGEVVRIKVGGRRKLLTVFEFNMLAHAIPTYCAASFRWAAQQLQDCRDRKSPRLQVAHLPRLFSVVGGQLSETPLPQCFERCVVIEIRFPQRVVDIARRDTFCLQPSGDTAATEAPGFLANHSASETLIGKQALRAQIIQRAANLSDVGAGPYQPRFKLGARVFAPSEQPDRLRPERARDHAPRKITRRPDPCCGRWRPARPRRCGSWPRSPRRHRRALSATRGCCPCLGRSSRRCTRTTPLTSR